MIDFLTKEEFMRLKDLCIDGPCEGERIPGDRNLPELYIPKRNEAYRFAPSGIFAPPLVYCYQKVIIVHPELNLRAVVYKYCREKSNI